MLGVPLSLSLPQLAAAAELLRLQPGGPAPPGGGNSGGDRWDRGGGGPGTQPPSEVMQLAAAPKSVVLTLASFAVTRKAYGKVSRTSTAAASATEAHL